MSVQVKVLVSSLLILFISSCGLVNQIRLRTANLDLEPTWSTQVTESELRTKYIGEKPFVYARINGKTDLLFMLDTGATVSMLFDTKNVHSLGLHNGYDLKMNGWGDEESSKAFQSKLEHIQLGDVHFKDVTIGFIPISKSRYFHDSEEAIFDGVIGWDLMHHFSWRFDKRSNAISISRLPAQESEKATVLPFDSFLAKLYVDASVKFNESTELESEFIIDTGSRHYVKLKKEYVSNRDIDIDSTEVTAADFGLNGKAEHQRVSLPKLTLGNLQLSNVKTNLITGGDEDEHWIIGSALLSQFITIVDYHSSKLHLVPYDHSDFKTRYNLLGLELRKLTSGNFVVRYVMPDMATRDLGLQVGDIITSIDDISASQITTDEWLTLSATIGEHRLCYERKNEEACDTVSATHIPGYSDKNT